ncbi:MAG: hypothetical protein ACREQD_16630 [Candidatus Binataceae bacterium]
MQTRILAALLCGCALAGTAAAETIVVNDQVQVRESQIDRPKRGITMSEVEKHFGAPVTRHATVGKPPITRWDYNGFSVFFEGDRVIHAVVTGGAAPANSGATATSGAAPASTPVPTGA